MENSNAPGARRNREKAKAEMQKLKSFYSCAFSNDMERVLLFERLYQAQASSGEHKEAAAEAVQNFDISLFQK